MFNGGSFRFWINVFLWWVWLPGFLSELRKDCGTIRREVIYEGLRKGFIITEIFITIVIIIMFKPVSRGLAIPNIFSENYKKNRRNCMRLRGR